MSLPASDSLYEVRIADGQLRVWHPVNDEVVLPLADIDAVAIEADDSGPWVVDAHWIVGAGPRGAKIPLGATGEDALLGWVQSLPGVDNEALVAAMGSTDVVRFVVWRRDGAAPASG